MKEIFNQKRIRSKWLIFLIDQVILSWSLTIALFAVLSFNFSEVHRGYFFIYLFCYICITTAVFIALRIHTGIVRYTNVEDINRIFWATLISNFIYWIIENLIIVNFIRDEWERFNVVLIINFFISSSLLIIFRVYVKKIFTYFIPASDRDKEVVLIYNCDESAIILNQALETQFNNGFKVMGFLNNHHDKVGKHIQQKRIYHSSSLSYLKERFNLSKILVCTDKLYCKDKAIILDECINLGIKVSLLPEPAHWVHGKLTMSQIKDLNINDLLQREPINLNKDNINQEISGKRILITGGAGSIGSEIVRQILGYNPAQLIICDQAESPTHELQLELTDKYPNSNFKVFIANVQNQQRMYKLFAEYNPQIVFHAAAYKHVPLMENNPSEAILCNILGTKNLADLSKEFNVEKFIMISTDKAVNPTNVMGATKRLAEIYIQSIQNINHKFKKNQTKFITTRFGNVLGSNGSVVPRFKTQIEIGGPITVTHPDITRFFMTIPEAVELVLEAGAMGKGGEIFVFDMGESVKIVNLAENMIKLAGLIPYQDIDIVFTGLRPGEKLYEEVLHQGECILPTHHQKIMIAEIKPYSVEFVNKIMDELNEAKLNHDEFEVISILKKIIPEYKSKNSIFEKLDHKIAI